MHWNANSDGYRFGSHDVIRRLDTSQLIVLFSAILGDYGCINYGDNKNLHDISIRSKNLIQFTKYLGQNLKKYRSIVGIPEIVFGGRGHYYLVFTSRS